MQRVPDLAESTEGWRNELLRIVCWNIARRHAAWRCLPDSGMDLALLQEAGAPPEDVAERVDVDPEVSRRRRPSDFTHRRCQAVRQVQCRLAEAYTYY